MKDSIIILTLICLFLAPAIAFSDLNRVPVTGAKPPVKDVIAESLSRGRTICVVIGDMIKAGNNTGEVVENAILLGHPACVVVKCAIDAGGELQDVIAAAFRVGASSDVIVTCSIDGGADSAALARIIERLCLPGLGYTPPESGQVHVPTFVSTLGGGGGSSVSPSRP